MESNPLPGPDLSFVSLDQLLTLILLTLVAIFMIHSAIVAYHWLTYGSNRQVAFAGVLAHLGGGLLILAVMAAIIIA